MSAVRKEDGAPVDVDALCAHDSKYVGSRLDLSAGLHLCERPPAFLPWESLHKGVQSGRRIVGRYMNTGHVLVGNEGPRRLVMPLLLDVREWLATVGIVSGGTDARNVWEGELRTAAKSASHGDAHICSHVRGRAEKRVGRWRRRRRGGWW